MLFACAFLFQFLVAGLTGIMLSVAPFNWQLHDSYFVVAHFHFTLIGGFVFGMFAGICYWFPKVTGKMLDERLGKLHFWLFAIGFNVTFLPMHILGFLGMPRRIYTYQPGRGWELTNMIATAGAFIQAIAIALMAWNIVRSLRRGDVAGDDPWDAWTLEWTTSSPPPEYNFETIPVVRSSRPLWDLKHPQDPDWQYE
jgi:cytochrome c oxidase subunit 1